MDTVAGVEGTVGQVGGVLGRQVFCETIRAEQSVSSPMGPVVWTLIHVVIGILFISPTVLQEPSSGDHATLSRIPLMDLPPLLARLSRSVRPTVPPSRSG